MRPAVFSDLKELVLPSAPPSEEGLFLDRLNRPLLEREFEAAGIPEALAARGYPEVSMELSREGREHRLRMVAPGLSEPLVQLHVSETTCVPEDPLLREHGLDALYLLNVHWLCLQDPRGTFRADRPPLPGQTHPGLGIGRRILGELMRWAYDWGKDALLNFPAYYHNAVLYATLFQFLSPARQGRLEALRRDLAALSVAEASQAVEEGRVVETASGETLQWKAAEMVAPLTRVIKSYLKSDDYAARASAVREGAHYTVRPGA